MIQYLTSGYVCFAYVQDEPYAIIVEGGGAVSERKLANHAGGTLLPSSLKVISNTLEGEKI